MSKVPRFQLDEITIRPGTYFNPQTEVMIVVDDSPEVDHEIFEREEFESSDWVLIAEDSPLDEIKRDELVERFQLTHQPGGDLAHGEDDLEHEDDPDADPDPDADEDEDDELDGVDDLEFDHE
jgi:hypothetical protein